MESCILSWNVGLDWRLDPKLLCISIIYPRIAAMQIAQRRIRGHRIRKNCMQADDAGFVADTILGNDPVACFLHEVATPDQLEILLKRLGSRYVGGLAPRGNSRYTAYIVRSDADYDITPLVLRHRTLPSPVIANKGFIVIRLNMGGRCFSIVSGKMTAGPLIGALGGRLHEVEQMVQIADWKSPDDPAIILGDLNFYEAEALPHLLRLLFGRAIARDADAIRCFINSGFKDLDASARRPTDTGQKLRLDFAFVKGIAVDSENRPGQDGQVQGRCPSARLEVLTNKELAQRGMDHCPIAVKLRLYDGEPRASNI